MTTIHPTNTSPARSAQQLHPQIHVSISASSPTLNLATRTEFSLTITFTLHNSPRPIPLFKSSSPLLQSLTALTSPGLAFTNARTGAAAPRPAFFHDGGSHPRCRLGRSHSDGDDDTDDGPPYPHEKPITYLRPGVPWSVTHSLGPNVMRQPRVLRTGPDGLPQRIEGPEQAFWFGAAGLEDGSTYKVGLSEEAGRGVKVFEREGVAWEVITAPVRVAAALGLVGRGLRRCGKGKWVLRGEVPVMLVQRGEFEFRGGSEMVDVVRLWA